MPVYKPKIDSSVRVFKPTPFPQGIEAEDYFSRNEWKQEPDLNLVAPTDLTLQSLFNRPVQARLGDDEDLFAVKITKPSLARSPARVVESPKQSPSPVAQPVSPPSPPQVLIEEHVQKPPENPQPETEYMAQFAAKQPEPVAVEVKDLDKQLEEFERALNEEIANQ